MSFAKFAFCVLLMMAAAGCNRAKQENAAQPTPAGTQQTSAQPAPQQYAGQPQAAPPQAPAQPAAQPSAPAQQTRQRVASPGTRPQGAPAAPPQSAAPASAPVVENKPVEPPPAPKPPEPQFAVVESGTKINIRLQEALDSGVNKTGDKFSAILDKDIVVDGQMIAPRGSVLEGKLPQVLQSGRVEGRAKMSLQLVSITIARQAYPLQTEMLSFEAESTKKKDATKVGVAAGIGTVIGAIAGGGKGAAIGAVVGGGAGGATVLATRGKEVKFEPEHPLTFVLSDSVKVKLP